MLAVKAIITNIKSRDISSLLEDIQALLKANNDRIACIDLCMVLKAIYHSISTNGDTKENDKYSLILTVVPCINLCIDYIENHFTFEDAVQHQILPVLFHIVKLYMKFDLYSPAFACIEYLIKLLSDKQKVVSDAKAYICNLGALFWNEALRIDKKNDHIDFEMEFVYVIETSNENILSSAQKNRKWYVSLVKQYLSISSDEHFQKNFPFGPKTDLIISKCCAIFFVTLLKTEQDVKKMQEIIKDAQFCVQLSVAKFKSANLNNELKKFFTGYLNAVTNIGFALYKTGLYSESIYFLEVSCDALCQYIPAEEMEDLKPSLWKKKEILIYCYFLSGSHKTALLSIVKMILIFADKKKECLELWKKVKRDALRMNDLESTSVIINDVLSEMKVSLNVEEKVFLLMEELKIYKTERCSSEEEIVRVAEMLLNIPCNKYDRGCAILEILTLPPLVAERISKILNKTLLEICLEGIELVKEYQMENPTNMEAKLLLSVYYFCLYCFKLQELHRFAESETEASLKSKSEDEENETCDIKPTFPLVTFFVEAEVIKNLEMALETWMGISRDLNSDWKELTESVNNWNLLSIINATAELFSTSAYDLYELRSWILLWNVASSIENKEYQISSSISLADFLLKCGYSDTAIQLLKLVENDPFLDESSTSQVLLGLKLKLIKSKVYLQKAMFDEGLILLLDILQNPVFEKKLKQVKLLKVQCLMLQTEFLLVPTCAFHNALNLKHFHINTSISSAMECATLSAGLWKVMLDKQNSDSNNDWMPFKTLLLRNFLKSYLLLAEQYFEIGDPRFARCYLKEGLKIAQEHILTFWASKMLIVLAKIDLLCQNPNDCLVKLDGLKYIMDQDTKKNASLLFSKINTMANVSAFVDESNDFIIASEIKLKLKRDIKQNYIQTNVHASPISTKMENFKFEVKFESYANGQMFSIFLLKLEIWALSCLHLIAEDKISFAKSQLKKLLQRCEILKKKNKSFLETLTTGKFDLPVPSLRYSCKSEIKLLTSVFLELSLIHFSENNIKCSEEYLKHAFNSLSDSYGKEKYAYPIDYALLNYHQIVMILKKDLKIASNTCLEFKICPSVQNKYVFPRRMLKSEKSALNMNTPTKCPQISVTPCLTKKKLCHAPSKKDILPRHLKKDIEITKSIGMKSLVFSSSDDDPFSEFKTPSPQKTALKNIRTRKKPEKLDCGYLKPKNSDKSIKASCDIWKCHTLFSPDTSKENKDLSCEVKSRNVRQTRQKNKNIISDSNHLQIPPNIRASRRVKTAKSKLKNTKDIVSIGNNTSECHDLASATTPTERISIEYNRSSSKNRLKEDGSLRSLSTDDVFYSDCPEVISKKENDFSTAELSLENSHPIIDDLCKSLDSMDISSEKNLSISVERLTDCIEKLRFIRSLVEHIAPYPLYTNICKLLAILLMANNEAQSRDKDSAFMLSETFSSTLRQIHLSNIIYYKSKLINGDSNCILETLRRNNQPICIQMDNILQTIPSDYTVVQISAIPDEEFKPNSKFRSSKLIVCRYQHNMTPIVMCINSSSDEMFNTKLFSNFENILLESTLIMKKNDDTKKWWKTRSTLDSNLKSMVEDMEDKWLGCWKGLILSKCTNEDRLLQLMKICDLLPKVSISANENLLLILLDSAPYLSREQLSAAVCHLWNCNPLDEVYSKVYKRILEFSSDLPISGRHPLILILDKNIQALPWESLPLLKDVPVSRIPSLSILSSLCATLTPLSYKEVDCNNTFYILNPSGDLKYSEEYFKPVFEKQVNWKGITGRVPDSQEFSSAFKYHDLFVYCGHGSGRQYLEGISVDTMKCRAATILMGCSSGRLKQISRQLEAYGIPLSYLMNGCPFVIGNLWDVTDKDIDRFTNKLLELFVPNYCQNQNSITEIADAVRQARNACKMRYLVGAAPIMYGIPTMAKN
ncbi:Separin like protein [Argiope bruennichi]|uniref:separase n=1 Tax=Argiope bruennichi TaxID=94029 RepID=A0A8T0E050_ARGBR|nr:Separin like protein [Argiope bruennichi]